MLIDIFKNTGLILYHSLKWILLAFLVTVVPPLMIDLLILQFGELFFPNIIITIARFPLSFVGIILRGLCVAGFVYISRKTADNEEINVKGIFTFLASKFVPMLVASLCAFVLSVIIVFLQRGLFWLFITLFLDIALIIYPMVVADDDNNEGGAWSVFTAIKIAVGRDMSGWDKFKRCLVIIVIVVINFVLLRVSGNFLENLPILIRLLNTQVIWIFFSLCAVMFYFIVESEY